MVTIKKTNSEDKDFQNLVALLDTELWDRYGTAQLKYRQYNIIDNLQTVIVVYAGDKPVGCGCFKRVEDDTAEVKRMFVEPGQRGKGIGSLIMKELEDWAIELQFEFIILETGKAQPEAIHLYRKQGYAVIPNYGPYADKEEISICMKKILVLTKEKTGAINN